MKKQRKPLSLRQKQIKRIRQAYRRQVKKGYIIDYEDLNLDDIETSDLKNITPQYLRDNSQYRVNVDTGEILWENPSYYSIDMQTDFVISNFREIINRYFPGGRDTIKNPSDYINYWLDNIIHQEGEEKVSNMLTEAKSEGLWLSPEEFYNLGSTYQFVYMLEDVFDKMDLSVFNGEVWENEYYD